MSSVHQHIEFDYLFSDHVDGTNYGLGAFHFVMPMALDPETFYRVGAGEGGLVVNATGQIVSRPDYGSPIADQRYWIEDNQRMLAVCLAVANQVRLLPVRRIGSLIVFSATDETLLNAEAGNEDGAFLFPLAVDRSTDGRLYILDAGNARVQVFDADGQYLTQWGETGSGMGQFDFGINTVEKVAGGIAVDDDGFIYVADVGNRRIQKHNEGAFENWSAGHAGTSHSSGICSPKPGPGGRPSLPLTGTGVPGGVR
jgi:sugar lactone lactonase YvrE